MRFPLLLVLLSASAVHMDAWDDTWESPATWKEVCRPGMPDVDTPKQHSDWCVIAALGSPDEVSWCKPEHCRPGKECHKPFCAKTCDYCEDAEADMKAMDKYCHYDQWGK